MIRLSLVTEHTITVEQEIEVEITLLSRLFQCHSTNKNLLTVIYF